MGSSRFPGKVLEEVNGRALLWHVIQRVYQAERVDRIIVATPDTPEDLDIAGACSLWGVDCYAHGAPQNVLSRFAGIVHALRKTPDILVRVTGDCPLVPPKAIDDAIAAVARGEWDYVTNAEHGAGWCDGEDIEVFTRAVLETLDINALAPEEREHVTLALRRRGFGCRLGVLLKWGAGIVPLPLGVHRSNWSRDKCSVDTPEELARIAARL